MKAISTGRPGAINATSFLRRRAVTQIVSRSAIVMIDDDGSSSVTPGRMPRSITLPATGAFNENNRVSPLPSAGMISAHTRLVGGAASTR